MSLIPSISLADFKKLNCKQIRQLKTCELTADGEYVCTVVIPNTSYIKSQVENVGQLSNSVGGKPLDEITEKSGAAV